MHLFLDKNLAANYQSPSQVVRVLTESWLQQNIYCPSCGNEAIESFQNNQPVADFFCSQCHEEYELKSKQGTSIGKKVADGAYHTMLERIAAENNPSFFFLCYRKTDLSVQHLIVIPKHFFTPNIIMPRAKGLPARPNYIMCSMDISQLPTSGKISLVTNGNIVAKDTVIEQWQQHLFLRQHGGGLLSRILLHQHAGPQICMDVHSVGSGQQRHLRSFRKDVGVDELQLLQGGGREH